MVGYLWRSSGSPPSGQSASLIKLAVLSWVCSAAGLGGGAVTPRWFLLRVRLSALMLGLLLLLPAHVGCPFASTVRVVIVVIEKLFLNERHRTAKGLRTCEGNHAGCQLWFLLREAYRRIQTTMYWLSFSTISPFLARCFGRQIGVFPLDQVHPNIQEVLAQQRSDDPVDVVDRACDDSYRICCNPLCGMVPISDAS